MSLAIVGINKEQQARLREFTGGDIPVSDFPDLATFLEAQNTNFYRILVIDESLLPLPPSVRNPESCFPIIFVHSKNPVCEEANVDYWCSCDPLNPQFAWSIQKVILRCKSVQSIEDSRDELQTRVNLLDKAHKRTQEMFKGLPIPCVTIDTDGLIMEWTNAAEQFFGLKSFEVWMKPLWEVLVQPKNRKHVKSLVSSVVTGDPLKSVTWSYPLANGEAKSLEISSFPLQNAKNQLVGFVLCFVDFTVQKQLETEITEQLTRANELSITLELKNSELEELSGRLQVLASLDGLTGLYNNRIFRERINFAMESVRKSNEPLSIFLTDVDKFKSFNDEFGHLVGDEVLRRVATILKNVIEQYSECLIARYGGEEFVAILRGMDEARAIAVSEECRVAIESAEWSWRQVTASFGVSTFHAEIGSLDDFVKEADDALYRSKHDGRNRVTHHSALPDQTVAA